MRYDEYPNRERLRPLAIGERPQAAHGHEFVGEAGCWLAHHRRPDLDRASRDKGEIDRLASSSLHVVGCVHLNSLICGLVWFGEIV